MQAEMEAWMKVAQPGPHHERMKAFEGRWKGDVTMWMGPGAEAMKETSTAEAKWILGGRFLVWKNTGKFGDMPFEGMAIEGYNNGDQRYESVWMDNFGTLMMFFTGSSSDNGRRREMKSQFKDIMSGKMFDYRTVYEWLDADNFTYTAYMDKGNGEFKNLVIHYTRQ
jgi:hypothetical protein